MMYLLRYDDDGPLAVSVVLYLTLTSLLSVLLCSVSSPVLAFSMGDVTILSSSAWFKGADT